MKEGIRILSIDDSPFSKDDDEVLVVGVVSRGEIVEGVISFYVSVDGDDATEKIIKKLSSSRFLRQVKLIAMNGITLGGLNIVDAEKLGSKFNLPILAITRRKPNKKAMMNAIRKSGKNVNEKLMLLEKINKRMGASRINNLYVQYLGIKKRELEKFVEKAYPMLRLAHIIASGVVKGESKGRV
ncbi:MAG: DUF99 family protein [Candidatus Micrarchaeia archaeon]|jgi:endonuclease V-like protein UPF0215 family